MIVWEPSGAWEDEELASVAARLDLVVAFDPMLSPRPPGQRVYARLRTLGARQSFPTAALEDIRRVRLHEISRDMLSVTTQMMNFTSDIMGTAPQVDLNYAAEMPVAPTTPSSDLTIYDAIDLSTEPNDECSCDGSTTE